MGQMCKHGHVDGALHIPCPKCQAEAVARENANLKAALRRLVELKDHKEANGKDERYQKEMPEAWAQARAVLAFPGIDLLKVPIAASKQEKVWTLGDIDRDGAFE